jgi:hypothetical protein
VPEILPAFNAWLFIPVAVVVALAVLAVRMAQKADFVIARGRSRDVEVVGRIAAAKRGAIKAFFLHDLGAPDRFKVRGSFGAGRALRLQFSGGLSPAQRQRVRNFLIEALR